MGTLPGVTTTSLTNRAKLAYPIASPFWTISHPPRTVYFEADGSWKTKNFRYRPPPLSAPVK
jgi:hypothetical protein